MLRRSQRWASDAGLGIIEVLIASAMMAFVALGIATISTNFQNSSNGVKFRFDADNLNEEMRALLSSRDVCTKNFGGLPVGNDNAIATITDGATPPTTYVKNGVYGDRSVVLTDMHLKDFAAGLANYSGTLTLTSSMRTQRTALGPQNVIRLIRVGVNLDSNNQISSCVALAKMSDGLWQRTIADVNNISFDVPSGSNPADGYVAVGTDTPTAMLDVSGDVRATSVDHRHMPMTLIPNTEGNPGAWWQGLGFNFEYRRQPNQWRTGGDGANSAGAAILFDHGPSQALSFYVLPNMPWVYDRNWTTQQIRDAEVFRVTPQGALGITTLATSDNGANGGGLTSRLSLAGLNGVTSHYIASSGTGFNQMYLGEMNGSFHFVDTNTGTDVAQITNGRLGVGVVPTETLHVRGRARIEQLSAGSATPVCIDGGGVLASCSSIRRFKRDVRPLDLGLDEVMRLKPSSYAWRGNGEVDLGFVAEEVAEISPVLVTRDKKGSLVGVKYAQMTALLTRALQQLVGRDDDRDEEIAQLKARVEALEQRLERVGAAGR